jgi:hypothetical protein
VGRVWVPAALAAAPAALAEIWEAGWAGPAVSTTVKVGRCWVDPMKPTLIAPGYKLLKLEHEKLL